MELSGERKRVLKWFDFDFWGMLDFNSAKCPNDFSTRTFDNRLKV